MSALPSRSDIAGTPSNAAAKTALGALFDFVAQRFASGTSGAGTATDSELQTTRRSLQVGLRGFLHGLTLSTAGSSATFTVAAGEAADSTHLRLMVLSSAISKTTSAWAVGTGNGALDTGAIANNTWYHVHLIERTDGTLRDVLVSLSATAPTMPSGYTYARRIGSLRTNGSAQWTKFVQDGDLFHWDAPVLDVSSSNPGSGAVTRTLSVPTGVNVEAFGHVQTYDSGTPNIVTLLSDLAISDIAPAVNGASLGQSNTQVTAVAVMAPWRVRTNTSAQIRSRISASGSGTTLLISTHGWYDRRGRSA